MFRKSLIAGVLAAVMALALFFSIGPALAQAAELAAGGGPWAALVGPGFVRYVPGVDRWEIEFRVVGDGWASPAGSSLREARVLLDGAPAGKTAVATAPWATVAGRLTETEVAQVRKAAREELAGRSPPARDLPRLERLAGTLERILREAGSIVVTLEGMAGTAEGEYTLEVAFDFPSGGAGARPPLTLTDTVNVVVAAIPTAAGWFAGDFHFHSTYSDGNKTIAALQTDLTNRGYYIGYLTDHTGALNSSGAFTSMAGPYPVDCVNCSTLSASVFPGVEMEIGHTVLGLWNGDGHCLGYGVSSTVGLTDKYWGAQAGLDKINGNNGAQSTAGIAHPAHFFLPWENWTVLRYYGIELMSGFQTFFDVNSGGPSRWRSECARLQGSSLLFVPSVRTASDYHSGWQSYVTHVKLPSDTTWFGGDWTARRAAVDAALKAGKTTISRKGSLPYITADGYEVGSTYTKAAGAAVSFTVYLKPVVSGTYNLYLYRDNMAATVWSAASVSLTAGQAYTWTVSHVYPGGNHYYWLYVSGADYGYTTPVYLRQ
jgi:hypothetical protein